MPFLGIFGVKCAVWQIGSSLLCLVPPPPLSAFHDTPVTLNCHCFVVLQTGYVEEEADS